MLRNHWSKFQKMNSFTTVFLLGLLALGHATPLTTVTQIPRTDQDLFREAVTDGFLVDQNLLTSLTTQAPRKETTPLVTATTQESAAVDNGATAEPEESAKAEGEDGATDEEGSAMEEDQNNIGRVQRHSDTFTSSTVEPTHSIPMTSSPEPEGKSTTGPSVEGTTTADALSNMIEAGSGDKETTTAATATTTEKTLIAFTSTRSEGPSLFSGSEGSGTGEPLITTTTIEMAVRGEGRLFNLPLADVPTTVTPVTPKPAERVGKEATEMPKGHVTPDWVIIVGFLIGVAVLVLLCVAVATRDKWNRPNQLNRTGVTDHLEEEEKALEMETFIHNEQPKENGKAEEYTVIPLDELPDSYTS